MIHSESIVSWGGDDGVGRLRASLGLGKGGTGQNISSMRHFSSFGLLKSLQYYATGGHIIAF
jgi:hypothetical protein